MNPSSSVKSDTQPAPPPTDDFDDLYWRIKYGAGGEPSTKRQKQSESEKEDGLFREPPSTDDIMSPDSEEEESWLLGRTEEEAAKMWHKYSSQIKESGGFDVDEDAYPGGSFAMYVPCPEFREDEGCYDLVKKMAREAVKTFKDDRGKQYELVDVENVVWTLNRLFYITFKAKQLDAPSEAKADDDVKTMQAVVFNCFSHFPVQSCRIKPTN
ncbi:uncharacterized protein [Coffea arabica]|uniref:Uncharacterized protein isoform X1 n=1 Tax=Coffea arabica TaxID=13443 RepID=A0A6P6WJV1_COFAR|nr:uncharacterized protein LOC113733720 [Coffea arabica]